MIVILLRFVLAFMCIWDSESFYTPIISTTITRTSTLMQMKNSNYRNSKRRPQNKRTAIRWTIQGVEKCLAVEDEKNKSGGGSSKSYNRLIDASLVDALYLMVNANNQKDILDAEKRIQVLMKNPAKFPQEVNERVIKATASAGLSSLSLTLLKALLSEEKMGDGYAIPSSVAYIAVLNCLRKNGRIDRIEDTIVEIADACRKRGNVGVDLIAFNIFLAALCDAAVKDIPFTSSSDINVTEYEEILEFNYTTLSGNNSSSLPTSSSEKYLYKALNLLRTDTAVRRFALDSDPDKYSYNSVLMAAAKCTRPGADKTTKSIMLSCLRGMKDRGIEADILTFNARIQAALASDDKETAIRLIDQILKDPNLNPDRYTINFMLQAFLNTDRQHEIWSILENFYDENVKSNSNILSSAFEAFLNTIVKAGDVEFADEIFRSFFLSNILQKSSSISFQIRSARRHGRLLPKTRHFNILLGGYSKAYQSVESKKSKAIVSKNTTKSDDLKVSRAYDLLTIMIRMVPLDEFSITSIMALPFASSEKITALLQRIEPEMTVHLNAAAYRSIITAFGKAGDPSSALWMAEEMIQSCRNQGRNVESWNVVLGALARCDNDECTLDILNSSAALARRNVKSQANDDSKNQFISLVDGATCLDASMAILDTMRNGVMLPEGYHAPKPNSQTYCLVASCMSQSSSSSETSKSNAERALALFGTAMGEGIAADGRFLNAVVRCFGDDIEYAIKAWKTQFGPHLAYESRSNKRASNVIAAYNGLMSVAGRAIRPDLGLRIAYAMTKAGVEPTEVTLNSYNSGKRIALENGNNSNKGLQNQYESLLAVECTKYNSKDKRRVNDRKIRIIL